MKSLSIRFACIGLLFAASAAAGGIRASSTPVRMEALDSLACGISALGYVPSGGNLIVLAASSGWFGPLSGVRVLPGESEEVDGVPETIPGRRVRYGSAPLSGGGDIVLVTAPPPSCVPLGLSPGVPVGTSVSFRLKGFGRLKKPEVAVLTPRMEIIELQPDSSGAIGFSVPDRGIYWVEVMQGTAAGPVIELLFPVIAGGDAADVFSGSIPTPQSRADSPSMVLAELNQLRESMGIPPLLRTEELDSAAGIRAGNLAFSGVFNHIDLEAGSLEQIIPPGVRRYGENIGRGRGYREAWSMILISPFHLRTCISGDYSRAGLAGAVDCREYQWQLILVQVFASGTDKE
ncbi:MAG: hypothetical protein R6U39_10655 [Candidatus Aegiribacteria sp.]